MQSVARARVGVKSRSGPFLNATSKNVASRRIKWKISLRYYAGRIQGVSLAWRNTWSIVEKLIVENDWRNNNRRKYGEIGETWRKYSEKIIGETRRNLY
jgi:hypothetical protein